MWNNNEEQVSREQLEALKRWLEAKNIGTQEKEAEKEAEHERLSRPIYV